MACSNKSFLYFGYGSNLLSKRIHLFNPSAVRQCIARLDNHRLDFGYDSKLWKGKVATIVPDEGEHIWGAVWRINMENMKDLDRQEEVERNIYQPIDVRVQTENSENITCRCYMLTNQPVKIPKGDSVPLERRPSISYLNVIINGAIESGLPDYYIEKLRTIEHNGIKADEEKIFAGHTMSS